ncbi:uncharacterized protein METZ01_LOCUS475912, partial [marine metagenome]
VVGKIVYLMREVCGPYESPIVDCNDTMRLPIC